MPAAIANDGNVNLFASFRQPAWHGLGTVFSEEITESAVMLEKAGLAGWDIREMDLGVTRPRIKGTGEVVVPMDFVTPAKAVVATIGGSDRVLGITGDRYEIVSNEDSFAFLQSLHDGARWETAGAIKDGRVVFGSMAMERDFVLDESGVADKVNSYLLVYTSHDGSTGVAGGVTPTRVVCQNTLNVAMGNISQTFKFRHTATVADRMALEAALWRQVNAYMDEFEKAAALLYSTSATDKDYFGIVETMFPKPEKDVKGAVKKWENRQGLFSQAWKGEPNAGIKNTAWGVFNALTEANQWGRNIRQGEKGSENFFAAGAGFDIPTNKFRDEAFKAALSLV